MLSRQILTLGIIGLLLTANGAVAQSAQERAVDHWNGTVSGTVLEIIGPVVVLEDGRAYRYRDDPAYRYRTDIVSEILNTGDQVELNRDYVLRDGQAVYTQRKSRFRPTQYAREPTVDHRNSTVSGTVLEVIGPIMVLEEQPPEPKMVTLEETTDDRLRRARESIADLYASLPPR